MNKKSRVLSLVLALIMLLVPLMNNTGFAENIWDKEIKMALSDSNYKDMDIISKWAVDDIKNATEKGFISGFNGEFKPKNQITRAEFTKIIMEAFDFKERESLKSEFKDVKESDWFKDYVMNAYKLGIITGYGKEFKPNNYINREEMSVILVRALEKKDIKLEESTTSDFKDLNSISSWARESVGKISTSSIMTGSSGRFNPKNNVTREMATVSIMRSYRQLSNEVSNPQVEIKDINKDKDVSSIIQETGRKMYTEINPARYGTIGGEWTLLGLARGNIEVPDNYYNDYYNNVVNHVKEKEGKLHNIKYTEYSRLIMSLTSIGKDVTNVGGYNLLEPLADFDTLIKQGINGPIFALIALDTNDYEIPKVDDVKNQTTRDMLIEFILNREVLGGGWNLGENPVEAYADITGMAIQSLAPYYNEREDVKKAVDRGIDTLSNMQDEDTGGYYSWGELTSESSAQIITALTAMNIDPYNDERFIKNGKSVLDNLLSYKDKDGGFYHVKPGGKETGGAAPGQVDPMATDQAMYALVAYNRYVNNMNSLYDMSDVK